MEDMKRSIVGQNLPECQRSKDAVKDISLAEDQHTSKRVLKATTPVDGSSSCHKVTPDQWLLDSGCYPYANSKGLWPVEED